MGPIKHAINSLDWILVSLSLLIPSLGLMVLYSATFDPDVGMSPLFTRQVTYFVAGAFIMFLVALIPSRIWYTYAYIIYGICMLLLFTVLIYGTVTNGSKRWLNFGGLNIQPSEVIKVALILAMGRLLFKTPPKNKVYGVYELFLPSILILAPVAVILKQPDLGTALAVLTIGAGMILFVGLRKWLLIFFLISGILVAGLSWGYLLKPYQKKRVETLFNPEADPQGAGWQIIQAKIAVGSGELFGKGFLQGSQTQLEFVPERTTDFIFCVLAEEWGFIGSILLLSLFMMLLARVIYSTIKSKDYFGSLVAVGVSLMIFFHAFVNLGMAVGFMPVVGLPLPLFSYGGSSMISMFFGLGLVLGLTSPKSVFISR